jgi:hypothetical protein
MSTGKPRNTGKLVLLAVVASCLIIAIVLIFTLGSPEASPGAACIELMKKVPAEYLDFEFWDVGTLRDDRRLSEMYDVWLEKRGGHQNIIPVAGIEYHASGGVLNMVTGDLPLGSIRDRLSKDYYLDKSYLDSEVWLLKTEQQGRGLTGAFILDGGLVVWGNKSNIEDYLGVINNNEPSFYEDDIAGIVERLPAGILYRASVTAVTGLGSITAMTVAPEGKGGYRWTSITRFLDTGDIANHLVEVYIESLENDFQRAEKIYDRRNETSPFRNFTLQRNGTEVTWSIYVNEEAMIALLF